MADPEKRTDFDKLLAEVESSMSGKPAGTGAPAARRDRPAESLTARLTVRAQVAALAGAVAAGIVWVLFALLPFLGAVSGAAGAFIATFVSVLVLRRR